MQTETIIQICIGIIMAFIANYVREMKNEIKENFKSIWIQLDKKQTVEKCTLFHQAHNTEHILEKENVNEKLNQNKVDINEIGKIARGVK